MPYVTHSPKITEQGIADGYGGFTRLVMEKAGGEGSRGGKVVGHTRAGKPVYEHGLASHPIEHLSNLVQTQQAFANHTMKPHVVEQAQEMHAKVHAHPLSTSIDKGVADKALDSIHAEHGIGGTQSGKPIPKVHAGGSFMDAHHDWTRQDHRDAAEAHGRFAGRHLPIAPGTTIPAGHDIHSAMAEAHHAASNKLEPGKLARDDSEHRATAERYARKAQEHHAAGGAPAYTLSDGPGRNQGNKPMEKATRFVIRPELHAMEKGAALGIASRAQPVFTPTMHIATHPGKRDKRGHVVDGTLEHGIFKGRYKRTSGAPIGVLTIEGHEVGLPYHMVIGEWSDAPRMMEMAIRTFAQGKFPIEGVFADDDAPKPRWGVTQ